MGSVTLRPNATIQGGTYGASYTSVSDASDSTSIRSDNALISGWGTTDTFPNSTSFVASFANATGTVPAGRKIISVQCFMRAGGSYPGASFRYGNTYTQLTKLALGNNADFTVNQLSSTAFTTPDWTYDLVDSMVVMLGMNNANSGNVAPFVYDVWLVVVYSELPAAPTAVTPAAGATVTTPNPALGGTMSAISTGQTQRMEWQFATNSTFTTNVQTYTESTGDLRASGATTEAPTTSQLALTNGTWWVRGRVIDQYGIYGPYSAGQSFTVNTPVLPTPTTVVPASGATVTTMTPSLSLTLVSDPAGRLQKGEWQIALDAGFVNSVRSVVELDSDLKASGVATEVLPSSIKITSDDGTTWYIRGRSVGNDGSVSAWTAGTTFTLAMAAPPVPTAITPANGATVSTGVPTVGATLGGVTDGSGRKVRAQWQFATNNTFTTNVVTVTQSTDNLRTSGSTLDLGPSLFQGLWYMRARELDDYGQAGAYSATQSFTVTHIPTASPTYPASDQFILYGTTAFTWSFSDPFVSDSQTAYQIIIERNDTGAQVYDSGKILSTAQTANIAVGSQPKDVKLRWKIRVWDQDNAVGNYSPYQLYTLSDLPIVTVTSPTNNQAIGSGQPTVTWTVDAATTQVSYRLLFKKISDGSTVYDTGTVNSSSKSVTAPYTILENNTSYSVTVYVTDTAGMTGSLVRNFSTSYQAPPTVVFTADGSTYDTLGYINVDWSTQVPDGFFIDWRVYRRLSTGTTWELVYVTNNQTVSHWHDWTATAGDQWVYAVTQTGGRSGLILESALVASAPVLADGSHYWLINPNDETDNLRISHVVSDSFSDDYDEAEIIIIGRGRKMNHGTRFGYDGELQAELRDDEFGTAREKRLHLQLIKAARIAYQMRNPFGDVLTVTVGNLKISRIAGVGTSEFCDVTIPYKEVF